MAIVASVCGMISKAPFKMAAFMIIRSNSSSRCASRIGGGAKSKRLLQVGEEFLFRVIDHAIGMADTHGHLVTERPRRRRLKLAGGGRHREFASKDILIDRSHIQARRGEAGGNLLNLLAFIRALRPIRERRQHAEADNGAVFLLIHGLIFIFHGLTMPESEANSHSNPSRIL